MSNINWTLLLLAKLMLQNLQVETQVENKQKIDYINLLGFVWIRVRVEKKENKEKESRKLGCLGVGF